MWERGSRNDGGGAGVGKLAGAETSDNNRVPAALATLAPQYMALWPAWESERYRCVVAGAMAQARSDVGHVGTLRTLGDIIGIAMQGMIDVGRLEHVFPTP